MALGAMAAKVVLPILPWPTTTILGERTRLVLEMEDRSKAMLVFQFNGWFCGFACDEHGSLVVASGVNVCEGAKVSQVNFSLPAKCVLGVSRQIFVVGGQLVSVNRAVYLPSNGKEIISAPHIRKALDKLFKHEPDTILDGELYADKFANDFNAIVSLVKKTKPTDADLKRSEKNIEYHVYDIPSVDGTFKERCIELDEIALDFPKCVKLVETHIVKNEDEVTEWYEDYIERGFEGQMLRVNDVYENKRSKFLLKHKSFVDEEYTIIDIVEGEGNRTGTAGYFVFQTAEGKPFKSNVKGTWEETAEMLKNKKKLIGREATVKYFNLTPDGIPRFPYVINIDRASYE